MNAFSDLLAGHGELGSRLSKRLDSVETQLQDVVRIDDLVVDAATSHLAVAGGKRLRPVLCLLTSELGPDPLNQAVDDSSLVVELTHLASLYHDDVMDEAPLRRGVPSAQYIFGNSSAIMAGDVLFARASSIVAKLGPRAVLLHATTFERLCVGQLHETVGPRDNDDPIDHYIQVLADKTGSLIAAAARYGVLSSGGSEELAEAVAQFGEKVGVAFQLADDVIDLVSKPELTGKTPGTDLLENVSTMPTLLLRKRQHDGTLDEEGTQILALLDSDDLNEENLPDVVARLRVHPVVAETRALADQWIDEALAELESVPKGEVREALEAFAHAMVDRMA
ncbi:polyprenyl synthetase family protein [Arcanobacterium ihumii]|uniref:polyprenyl synthetase family protein n=1 Tax=Arcanobacterium ihumii TaxID=2138162 RepID=UPI000F538053|nr:polyprenyl synthetase family protein [Arcanobacterium ihumii]